MSGLTQAQVVEILKIIREAATNLEKIAYVNIMRARQTLKIIEETDLGDEVTILTAHLSQTFHEKYLIERICLE